jgi:hypothetical protein
MRCRSARDCDSTNLAEIGVSGEMAQIITASANPAATIAQRAGEKFTRYFANELSLTERTRRRSRLRHYTIRLFTYWPLSPTYGE